MTLRPPRSHARKSCETALDYELAQEQAAALGRLGRALEVALAALSRHDHAQAEGGDQPPAVRERLLREASHALWCFIIQREVCGLRDQRLVGPDYRVPREVQNRMGVFGSGGGPSSA